MRLPWDSMANRPTPHRPANRPIQRTNGQKEKKQKKELSFGQHATSIGLRPLSVNQPFSVIWPSDFPPAASRTPKKPMKNAGFRPPTPKQPRKNAGFRPPSPRIGHKWVRFGSPDLWTGALGVKKVQGIVSPYSRDEKTQKMPKTGKHFFLSPRGAGGRGACAIR